MKIALQLVCAVALVSCSTPKPKEEAPPAAAATPKPSVQPAVAEAPDAGPAEAPIVPPKLRLPAGARPVRVSAELTIIPTQPTFSGKEELTVRLDEPAKLLWLNADQLTIKAVEPAAKVIPGNANFVGLQFETPLPAGESSVRISWQGVLSDKDTDGAFRQQENGVWYVLTHLEPLGARRIFPSFDEPSFKVPWRVALRIRAEDQAYFNTPIESQSGEPGGLKLVRFAETKPLPDYLLAFGVGPFERVPAGKMKSGAPVGVVVTRGKTSWAKYSAQSSPRLMNLLEDYFGVPYHYPKLDLIEIPLGTGAMENPGLITFNQRINLAKPGTETPQFHRRAASVEAHEFAHLWFGDLVTTAWWDDIWLNEAFATWMSSKITERYQPSWNDAAARVQSMNGAMQGDSLVSTRRIRQPIESEGDIKTAFDGITYQKGAAVIGMFEGWVGNDVFQKGVHRYLTTYADGNATAKEFLAAISAEAGKDVAPAFSSFLDQPGVPLVTGTVACDGGKPRVELTQRRYYPLGADTAKAPQQTWQIPVCVRTDTSRTCALLADQAGTFPLATCPKWAMLNSGATGYYRSQLDDKAQQALTKNVAKLSVPEKELVLFDVEAAARAGATELARAMELTTALAGDRSRPVVEATLSVPSLLHSRGFVPEELRPRFAAWVRSLYGARAKALGWTPLRGESEDDALLRPRLLGMVGNAGEDLEVRATAKKLALAWLDNHAAVSPEIAETALHLAAIGGDQALWDRLHERARAEKDRTDRQRILAGMALFRDPAIVQRALPLVLASELDPREAMTLLYGATVWPSTRQLALEFVEKNYDALVARLPRDSGAGFVMFATSFCDEQHRKDAEEFFGPRAKSFAGGDRRYAQALEGMRQCAAFREKAAPSVAAFLQRR